MSEALKIRVLHGPNLNLLGQREPERYGRVSLAQIDETLVARGRELGVEVVATQHNGEGELVDAIQESARGGFGGVLINPAAYTHTSVALRDALLAVGLPTVEVHLTNTYAREEFRHKSLIADVAVARVMGFGDHGYLYGLDGLVRYLRGA